MKKEKEVTLIEVKEWIRERIKEEYGSIPKFLRSEDGKQFGGLKIKPYLYPAGPTSYETLSKLAEFLGVGSLSRKMHVIRTTTYSIKKGSNGKKN